MGAYPDQVFVAGSAVHYDAIAKTHAVDNQVVNNATSLIQHAAV